MLFFHGQRQHRTGDNDSNNGRRLAKNLEKDADKGSGTKKKTNLDKLHKEDNLHLNGAMRKPSK